MWHLDRYTDEMTLRQPKSSGIINLTAHYNNVNIPSLISSGAVSIGGMVLFGFGETNSGIIFIYFIYILKLIIEFSGDLINLLWFHNGYGDIMFLSPSIIDSQPKPMRFPTMWSNGTNVFVFGGDDKNESMYYLLFL